MYALLDRNGRLPAKFLFDPSRVSECAIRLARPLGNMHRGRRLEEFRQVVDRHGIVTADVETQPYLARFGGANQGVDGIGNIGEIARLLAVAKNYRLSFFQIHRAEFREHSGIRRSGILPRPEHVEITQRHVFQAITAPENLQIQFAHKLGNSVRRNRHRPHVAQRHEQSPGRRAGLPDVSRPHSSQALRPRARVRHSGIGGGRGIVPRSRAEISIRGQSGR